MISETRTAARGEESARRNSIAGLAVSTSIACALKAIPTPTEKSLCFYALQELTTASTGQAVSAVPDRMSGSKVLRAFEFGSIGPSTARGV